MAEPRARARGKGQVFNTHDLSELLYAYSATPATLSTPSQFNPLAHLPTTVAVLDEILTDFIIETCHAAALSASYSRRQKIKVDDFKWVLRKDEKLLGRVLEQLWRERTLKEARKTMDFRGFGNEGVGELEGIAEMGGVGGEVGKKRRRRKRKADDDAGGERKRAAV